jgi:hypothetical protein
MKSIRNLLTITAAITLAASNLTSVALGEDSPAEPAAAPVAASATMASLTPASAVAQSTVRSESPAVAEAATPAGRERRCERVERIGKFVKTRCD